MGQIIRENLLTIISIIISIVGIILEWRAKSECARYVMMVLWVALGIFVVYKTATLKRHIINVYDMLCTMSRNNKLHPIRETVMVWNKKIHNGCNKVHINQIKFVYNITESEKKAVHEKILNVEYQIHFQIKESFWMRFGKRICFSFFAICENGNPEKVRMVYRLRERNLTERDMIVEPVTLSGESGDRMGEFAGLYGIKVFLTDAMAYKHRIDFSIFYEIKDHIYGKDEKYSFVIIPLNYSKNVKEIEIEILDNERNSVYNPVLQEVKGDEQFRDINTFIRSDDIFMLDKPLKPDKYACYFVQFDLENIYKKEFENRKTEKEIKTGGRIQKSNRRGHSDINRDADGSFKFRQQKKQR